MAQTITVPSREYTAGIYEVELRTLPGNSIGAEFIFTRNALPDGELALVEVFTSFDNGGTWLLTMSRIFPGGVRYKKDGVTVDTQSTMMFTFPGEADANGNRVMKKGTDVKVRATVYQTFSTAITINSITRTGK